MEEMVSRTCVAEGHRLASFKGRNPHAVQMVRSRKTNALRTIYIETHECVIFVYDQHN